MKEEKDTKEVVIRLTRHIKTLSVLCLLLVVCIFFVIQFPRATPGEPPVNDAAPVAKVEAAKETATIPDKFEIPAFDTTSEGKLAEYGYKLINETYALIGPGTAKPVTGNRLACGSCHLGGGTKPFAAPYVGLSGIFPIYIGREDKIESLEERINGCFERSMNGVSIDVNSKEMRAIVTYIKHLSKAAPVGVRLKGQGFIKFTPPDRMASVDQGVLVYKKHCIACHGANGEGMKGVAGNREGGYIYPPLWGADSYNDGAGMSRILTAARFIKGNMPFGATHSNPVLTDDEAYDVAAYINSHPRPVKINKEKDYPNLKKKPKDCPYPPYADNIPQQQHRLGPFNFAN
ncbi:MAG: c-type cytochrome [Agriterribacter sp.]